ncbi:hypothetical protein FOL47_002180 [Perkinsus chesapeaki]|uniref:Uncharacterized protein n=1 Tax=Perkinsus chesapeaki TaxID=330153 RepID=A0A7J6MEU7_PERCH|nr:hypothetical protein FOL47_002180 [Perkinsus chesapeaki]
MVKPDWYADTMTLVVRSKPLGIDFKRSGIRFEAEQLRDGGWLIHVGYEENGIDLLRALRRYVGTRPSLPTVLFYFDKIVNKLYFAHFYLNEVDCLDVDDFWPPTGFPALQSGGVYSGGSSEQRWPFKENFSMLLTLSATGTRLSLSYQLKASTAASREYGENVKFTPERYDGPENTIWAIFAPNPHVDTSTAEFLADWQEDVNVNLTKFRTAHGLIPLLYIHDDGSEILFGSEEGYVTLLPCDPTRCTAHEMIDAFTSMVSPITHARLTALKPPRYIRDSQIDRSNLSQVLGEIIPSKPASITDETASVCSNVSNRQPGLAIVKLTPLPAEVAARTVGDILKSIGVHLRSVALRRSSDGTHSSVYAEVYDLSDARLIHDRLNARPYVINFGDGIGHCRICLSVSTLEDNALSEVASCAGVMEVVRNI